MVLPLVCRNQSTSSCSLFTVNVCRVDYVDSFGRTRRCLKKDLTVFQQRDAELNKQPGTSSTTTPYGNFVTSSQQNSSEDPQNISGLDEEARKRQRLLWEKEEEENRQKSKVHYQDILYQGRIIYSADQKQWIDKLETNVYKA